MTDHPLSAVELETKLDQSLDPALSARRTTHLAEALASFARGEQEFVLRWTDIIARTNTEMAYLFASQAPEALRRMTLADMGAWIVQAMDYLPRIYGAVNWTLVDDVKKLPLKMPDIYHRLTT